MLIQVLLFKVIRKIKFLIFEINTIIEQSETKAIYIWQVFLNTIVKFFIWFLSSDRSLKSELVVLVVRLWLDAFF